MRQYNPVDETKSLIDRIKKQVSAGLPEEVADKSKRTTKKRAPQKKQTTKKTTKKVAKKQPAKKDQPRQTKKTESRQPKRKVGRPRKNPGKETAEEELGRYREYRYTSQKKRLERGRDIYPLPVEDINWERRLACKYDFKLFCKTYMPTVFKLNWANYHDRLIRRLTDACIEGGMYSIAVPRGGGKTALCRASILWATSYGHRRFPFFIGSKETNAQQTLDAIIKNWMANPNLRKDFPEVGYGVFRAEGRFHGANVQLYNGAPSFLQLNSGEIRYPCLILPEDQLSPYMSHDPDSVMEIMTGEMVTRTSGIMLKASGIDGSIRGEAETHPITLEQPRPDVIIFDDIQKDQKAESPTTCEKVIRLVDAAVQGLAGPDETIAAIMPCTVIREGDVSDTYLDPLKKPEWVPERWPMVLQWPAGITNEEITLETEEGKLWNQYSEERNKSLRQYQDNRLGNAFYQSHREAMDRGFEVSWDERYNKKGRFVELSAQQSAMNRRLAGAFTFASEFQQRPISIHGIDQSMIVTQAQFIEKATRGVRRREVPVDYTIAVAFIDPQEEVNYWTILVCDHNFTGIFTDYGTWPPVTSRTWFKNQTLGWSMVTREFFKRYPEQQDKATRTKSGRLRAPFEAKVYFSLSCTIQYLKSLILTRMDEWGTRVLLQRIGIDTRWGQASSTIKRFIRESGHREVIPYFGDDFPPNRRQLEEYTRTKGWIFDSTVNPLEREDKWVYHPDKAGMYVMDADVNRLKSFLMARIGAPPGSKGSIFLPQGSPEEHSLFASHICDSEYPEPISARGRTKHMWQARGTDNDWLDCAVGCCAMASMMGAHVPLAEAPKIVVPRKRLSEMWKEKRENQIV